MSEHATPDRVAVTIEELEMMIRALRDRDCPYLGNYKLGYDAALDDVLVVVTEATRS